MDKKHFGYFDAATRNKYALATSAGITPSDPEVVYWVSPALATKFRSRYACTPGGGGSSTVHAKDVAQIAYLDVGRWGGGGAWQPQRSFGIAAGRSVFYCSYRKPAQKGGPVWTAATHSIGAMPDGVAITPLLNKLSSSSRLGAVFVEEATYNQIPCILPAEGRIYVFLGDLHLPLLTQAKDIGLGSPLSDSECMEFGRLDMKNPVVIGLAAAGMFLYPRDNEKLGIRMLSPEVPFVEVDEHEDLNKNMMAMDRAKLWYDTFAFYDNSRLGADIFEPEAGAAQVTVHGWG